MWLQIPRLVPYLIGDRMELLFVILFAYLRKMKSEKLQKVAEAAAAQAKQVTVQAKQTVPMLTK